MITAIPLPRSSQGKELVCEQHTHEKALVLFFLLELGILSNVLHHVGDELHSMCEFQGRTMIFLILDNDLDIHEVF